MPNRKQVSERAIIQRVNRKLAERDEALRSNARIRGADVIQYDHNLGRFYTINTRRNFVVATHLDLEQLAREEGVLQAWEQIEVTS